MSEREKEKLRQICSKEVQKKETYICFKEVQKKRDIHLFISQILSVSLIFDV